MAVHEGRAGSYDRTDGHGNSVHGKSVAVLQKFVPEYRLSFFEGVRQALARSGVALSLYHGDPVGTDASKGDARALHWSSHRPNRVLSIGSRHLVWQPALKSALKHDLVIVEQANKLLVNYPLLASSKVRLGPPVAFWGHGANLQARSRSAAEEMFKRRYSTLPHWWFAYTEGSKRRVTDLGFPADRVTVVQNAIDTRELRAELEQVPPSATAAFAERYGLEPGFVGIFLGSLYEEKRLPYLLDSAVEAHRADPRFTLLVAGDGPGRTDLSQRASALPFVHYLGRLDGPEKAVALRCSDMMLMPGLVGLGILDAFTAELPIVTTDIDFHSPEIEYLRPDENGLMLGRDTTAAEFAGATLRLMNDPERVAGMRTACAEASERFTVDEMVARFAGGVLTALSTRDR